MIANIPEAPPDRAVERRQPRPPGQPLIDELRRMPDLIVLDRLPTPAVAIDRAGAILFANGAFCDMVGYAPDELSSMNFKHIFRHAPARNRWIALIGRRARGLVRLRHSHGHSVWARMSQSALHRRDDTVALVTFDDRTEEFWLRGVNPDHDAGKSTKSASRAR